MDISGIGSIIIALGAMLMLMAGLSVLIHRLRRNGAMPYIGASWGLASNTISCRVSRGCALSIVTLGGIRFAVLNGVRSDQFVILPRMSDKTADFSGARE